MFAVETGVLVRGDGSSLGNDGVIDAGAIAHVASFFEGVGDAAGGILAEGAVVAFFDGGHVVGVGGRHFSLW